MKLATYLSLLNRRQWLKVLLLGVTTGITKRTASGDTTGPQPFATQLTPSTRESAIIPIRVSQFAGLDQVGGSISLYFSEFRYPIVINRADTDVFFALDPTCTHQGCQVGNYNRDAYYMECDCHGSLYTIEGRVALGPAQEDLSVYPSRFDGDDLLEIELIGVPLRIDSVTLQTSAAPGVRLRMDFPGVAGCKYQVKYHPNLTSPPQPALFSLSAGGTAGQSSFTVPEFSPTNPLSGDGTKSIWVDATGSTGFFAIEMVLGESIPL